MNEAQRAAAHEGIRDAIGIEKASIVIKAVDERYRMPQPVNVYLNLCLREAWRLDHDGDTRQWDSSAQAAGFDPAVYEKQLVA